MIKKIKEFKLSDLNRILRKVMAHINKFEGVYKCLFVYSVLTLILSEANSIPITSEIEIITSMCLDICIFISKLICVALGMYECLKIVILNSSKYNN